MKSFKSFLAEQKNTHLSHLEDAIIYGGADGARQAINAIRAFRDMLQGHHASSVSVKWDGAPAIFAGTDPSDGKFFVAKKGIFAKNPKVYKTSADVDADTSGDLATKLKLALKHLPSLGIKGVIQGDFLFSQSDIKSEKIDGENFVTFHPNTIIYAVPTNTPMSKNIKAAKLGDCLAHIIHRQIIRNNESILWCECRSYEFNKKCLVTGCVSKRFYQSNDDGKRIETS